MTQHEREREKETVPSLLSSWMLPSIIIHVSRRAEFLPSCYTSTTYLPLVLISVPAKLKWRQLKHYLRSQSSAGCNAVSCTHFATRAYVRISPRAPSFLARTVLGSFAGPGPACCHGRGCAAATDAAVAVATAPLHRGLRNHRDNRLCFHVPRLFRWRLFLLDDFGLGSHALFFCSTRRQGSYDALGVWAVGEIAAGIRPRLRWPPRLDPRACARIPPPSELATYISLPALTACMRV